MQQDDKYPFTPASPEELRSSALGCVAGAFIGDSCGGSLEFLEDIERNMDRAMKMGGGGHFGLQPGQITDDSEMAMSLADGIIRSLKSGKLTAAKFGHSIVMAYKRWYKSGPFDIGNTTINGICYGVDEKDEKQVNELYEHTLCVNMDSLSNGCIMRLSPLAVWLSQFYSVIYPKNPDLAIRGVICATMLDTSITHSNATAIMVSSVYCVLLTHLIACKKNEFAVEGAMKACLSVLDKFSEGLKEEKKTIKNWIKTAYKANKYVAFPHEGFLKHGFCDAITIVNGEKKFKEELKKILRTGGDTDTNAAIAMASYGAYNGLESIDDYYIKGLDEAPKYIRNDVDFTSSNYKKIVDKLLEVGATEEDIIGIMKTMKELETFAGYIDVWDIKFDE